MTIPKGSRSSRPLLLVLVIGLMAVIVSFQLSDSIVPDLYSYSSGLIPAHTTEYDVIRFARRLLPYIMIIVVAISEYHYVNLESIISEALSGINNNHKVSK